MKPPARGSILGARMPEPAGPPLTVTLIARDEEDRLPAALEAVAFAEEIVVVVDAATTDRTAEIAEAAGARVLVRAFDGFGAQKNAAAALASNRWVLSIDADEIVSPALALEIRARLATVAIREGPAGRVPDPDPSRVPRARAALRPRHRRPAGAPLRPHARAVLGGSRAREGRRGRPRRGARRVHPPPLVPRSRPLPRQARSLHDPRGRGEDGRRARGARPFLPVRVVWEFLDRAFLRLGVLDGTAGLTFAALSASNTLLKYLKLRELERAVARGERLPSGGRAGPRTRPSCA